jgi:hypothetical protein
VGVAVGEWAGEVALGVVGGGAGAGLDRIGTL